MSVAIIDYGAGNVGSLANMLTRKCGCACSVESHDSDQLQRASHWILPGVGHFGYASQRIEERGISRLIHEFVERGGTLLGICLGAQLLLDYSEEGESEGLGLIPGSVRAFSSDALCGGERIPHMGWADVEVLDSTLKSEMMYPSRFYFVHSYYMNPQEESDILMTSGFGKGFVSAVRRGNITGVQFHPEKSHQYGITFLKAWLAAE